MTRKLNPTETLVLECVAKPSYTQQVVDLASKTSKRDIPANTVSNALCNLHSWGYLTKSRKFVASLGASRVIYERSGASVKERVAMLMARDGKPRTYGDISRALQIDARSDQVHMQNDVMAMVRMGLLSRENKGDIAIFSAIPQHIGVTERPAAAKET
ncbi:MAG: hypothetical protein WA790_00220 [Sulfitobacter sp.]